ncbi:hypothetical protein CPC08DRAFT_770686 [Agrocybe pediades]|nr:hypothetical protein CPC08DRAFT_770686 [Agrocybe pediades]
MSRSGPGPSKSGKSTRRRGCALVLSFANTTRFHPPLPPATTAAPSTISSASTTATPLPRPRPSPPSRHNRYHTPPSPPSQHPQPPPASPLTPPTTGRHGGGGGWWAGLGRQQGKGERQRVALSDERPGRQRRQQPSTTTALCGDDDHR